MYVCTQTQSLSFTHTFVQMHTWITPNTIYCHLTPFTRKRKEKKEHNFVIGFQLPVKFTALNTTITGSSVRMQFSFEFYAQRLKHNATEIHALPFPQTRSPLLEQPGCSLDMPVSVHGNMGAVAVPFSPFFNIYFFMEQCADKIWFNPQWFPC